MATIERKSLPSPNFRIITMAEADKAEIIAQAAWQSRDFYPVTVRCTGA